ncbi:MAG: rhodanese-like domain-containing protein [Albidovulum sp.]
MLTSRRAVLTLIAGGTLATGYLVLGPKPVSADKISVHEALDGVRSGQLHLVDIRRPDEWHETGIAEGANLIDLRESDFMTRLEHITGGNKSTPVALICARGVRSRKIASRLKAAGYTAILDVSEGMLGSSDGAGWIARGLPLTTYNGE